MSEAPERIWAAPGMPGYITDGPEEGVYDVEYIRADRIEALEAQIKEAAMQRLADLGQLQEAHDAQKAAEARVADLEDAISWPDHCRDYLKPGETVRQRMDRFHNEVLGLLKYLEGEKIKREALEAKLADWDRILRSSVPDRHKGATSPVGAVQSHGAELEAQLATATEALEDIADGMGEETAADIGKFAPALARAALAKIKGEG